MSLLGTPLVLLGIVLVVLIFGIGLYNSSKKQTTFIK